MIVLMDYNPFPKKEAIGWKGKFSLKKSLFSGHLTIMVSASTFR